MSETFASAPAPRFGRIASAAVGLALLGVTLALVDRQQLFARLHLDPRYLALGASIALPQLALSALRWQFTARRLGVPLGYRAALREYALSTALNTILPFGLLGDAVRVARHDRRLQNDRARIDRSPLSAALHSVLVERSAGQLVLGFWALASLPLWISGPAIDWALALLAGAALLAASLYWSTHARAPSFRPLAMLH
ncbi:MAG TPA: lysylphosphatidylglycerol synthase transmembrane domain-containing protein, partial [Polyangiales bacterium]|nr:lysylphosphatidylglycerol synthase transmembrane domain-containing protein [Polyangiales bacterium]